MSAGQRVREQRAAPTEPAPPRARNPALEIFLWTRAAIWAAALFSLFVFVPNRHPRAARWDDPTLTHDLGAVTDVWARWDSVWFLRIAEHGYSSASGAASAFYPLYPGSVAVLGRALFGHYVLAGILVSLAAALGSCLLLYRLAEERLGADGARRAVLYLALFPFALFLQAVYSESLYLLLTLAAFVLAERKRYLLAGCAAGLALLTRPTGLALLPALALIAWQERDRVRALASLAVAPVLFAAYPLYLWRAEGDPWAVPARAEDLEPAPLSGRAAGRDLGRAAGRLGRRRATCVRLAHARLLDSGAGHRPDPGSDAQPGVPRLPRPVRRADRDRLEALRRALRAFRSG